MTAGKRFPAWLGLGEAVGGQRSEKSEVFAPPGPPVIHTRIPRTHPRHPASCNPTNLLEFLRLSEFSGLVAMDAPPYLL
jgi:hypothetical protein